MAREPRQVLCVVNLREHAATLFDALSLALEETGTKEPVFHLSTRMCAAHRLRVLAEIRSALTKNESCCVISTQLIEAGVDLDFPVAFRALGPLDSIIQVAGRTDRNGLLTAALGQPAGRLVVFKPRDHRLPPGAYENATGITETMAKSRSIQSDDLEQIEAYFERLYTEGADLGSNLQELRMAAKFALLAEQFEMISSRTQDVFVPFGDSVEAIEELMKIGVLTPELRRRLRRYTVGLQPWEFHAAQTAVLNEVRPERGLWVASPNAYHAVKGLQLSLEAEQYII